MPVPGHFRTDEVGFFKGFFLTAQFHFGHDEPVVVTMELIHFEDMSAERDEIPVLVYHARLTQLHKLPCLLKRYLLLEFVAGQTAVTGRPLDGQVALVIPDADADSVDGGEIALLYMAAAACQPFPAHPFMYQEFPFYLQSTHRLLSC